jgi:manganese transport protein
VTTTAQRSLAVRVRSAMAFAGPAFLVCVGYIDPGNWGTDLAAGSRYGYDLLWVLVAANLLALLLQHLSARLGVATGRDLAQLVGERLRPWPRRAYAVLAVSAMLVTEVAEFVGVVVGLQLLLGLPLSAAVVLGGAAVAGLLALGLTRRRPLERAVFLLLAVVAGAYVVELWISRPGREVAAGLLPSGLGVESGLVALAILGAVVMPHNLFLHSGLVLERRRPGLSRAGLLRRATVESAVALNLALLVNAAILITAAAAFFEPGLVVESLDEAHRALEPLLGPAAAVTFAVALLAAGLASCITGGMASQMVLDGLVLARRRPPLLVRRLAALVPAALVLGSGVGEIEALLWTQIVLSLALPFVVVPMVWLCRDRELMGDLVLRGPLLWSSAAVAVLVVSLNAAGLLGLVL